MFRNRIPNVCHWFIFIFKWNDTTLIDKTEINWSETETLAKFLHATVFFILVVSAKINREMRLEERTVAMTGDGDGAGSTFTYSVECNMTTMSCLKFYSLHILHSDYMIILVPTLSLSMFGPLPGGWICIQSFYFVAISLSIPCIQQQVIVPDLNTLF